MATVIQIWKKEDSIGIKGWEGKRHNLSIQWKREIRKRLYISEVTLSGLKLNAADKKYISTYILYISFWGKPGMVISF